MTTAHTAAENLGAEYFQDPDSVHARLRAQRPVSAVIMPGGTPVWLVLGYAEARAALADPRLHKTAPGWPPQDSIFAALERHMLNSDPPGSRAAAPAGEQGLHATPGGAAPAADSSDHREPAR